MEHTFPSETVRVIEGRTPGCDFVRLTLSARPFPNGASVDKALATEALRELVGSATAIHPGCHRWDSKTEAWQ